MSWDNNGIAIEVLEKILSNQRQELKDSDTMGESLDSLALIEKEIESLEDAIRLVKLWRDQA